MTARAAGRGLLQVGKLYCTSSGSWGVWSKRKLSPRQDRKLDPTKDIQFVFQIKPGELLVVLDYQTRGGWSIARVLNSEGLSGWIRSREETMVCGFSLAKE